MSDQEKDPLIACIGRLAARLQNYRGRALGEQNTKASLIEPLLEALGWDTRDFDEVHREFKAKRADRPVDYALQLAVKPRVFIEAKGLGENLADRKWVAQILGYATVAGVSWCVLTDGDDYRFYNASVPVDADEKLFCQARISDGQRNQLVGALRLISRASVENDVLGAFSQTHFVDRQVQRALQSTLDAPGSGLLRLLRRQLPTFTEKQIRDSIARLAIDIKAQPAFQIGATKSIDERPRQTKRAKDVSAASAKLRGQSVGVTLQQIVNAGLLPTPLKLSRKYKGKVLLAILHADGSVEFGGQRYATCSTAAEHARGSVTGRRMSTNGWTFWQYLDEHQAKRELAHVRGVFLNGSRKT